MSYEDVICRITTEDVMRWKLERGEKRQLIAILENEVDILAKKIHAAEILFEALKERTMPETSP